MATMYAVRRLVITCGGELDEPVADDLPRLVGDSITSEIDEVVLDLTAVTSITGAAIAEIARAVDVAARYDAPVRAQATSTVRSALRSAATLSGRLTLLP